MFLYSRLQLLHQLYIRQIKNSGVEDCLPVAPDRIICMEFLAAELSFSEAFYCNFTSTCHMMIKIKFNGNNYKRTNVCSCV